MRNRSGQSCLSSPYTHDLLSLQRQRFRYGEGGCEETGRDRVVYPRLTLMIYYHYRDSGFGMEKEDVKRQVGTELSILALHS